MFARFSRALLTGLILASCFHVVAPATADDPALLRLKVGTFDPVSEQAEIPQDLRLSSEPSDGIFVVQFRRAIDSALLEGARSVGAALLGYLPDDAYLVRLPAGAAERLRSRADVRWVGPVQPGWKIAPDLGTRPYLDLDRRAGGKLRATADLFDGEDVDAAAAAVEATGASLVQIVRFGRHARLHLHATRQQLVTAARVPAVSWIEEAAEITTRNNTTRWVIQENIPDTTPVWDRSLHGEGQIVGHIDGRIDMNSCYFVDPVNNTPGPGHRKVVAYRSNFGLGADSHGTHTAGTVAGDATPNGGTLDNAGNAWAAKLSHSNLNDISGSGGQTSNLYDYLAAAHADGARVHTNSWGDDGTTAYTTWSLDVDRFSYDFEDSLVLFAVTNTSTLRTPENAKNCLGVGASQNGGSAGSFCSGGRGPTNDGRRKPEVFAPGCSIVSARNASACSTRTSTGTSMASPAVAAAGALVRQYFEEGWYPTGTKDPNDALVPSGALTRAAILNGAVDMTGIGGYPSDQEGWGRVLLENSLFFDGDARSLSVMADVRNADGLATGQTSEFALEVVGGSEPLKVTLAFTEPPASLFANPATINNLDLEVVSPSGTLYRGNVIDTGSGLSTPGGSADPRNNVEMVILAAPETGLWTVRVAGAAVNQETQGFALVATGAVVPFDPGTLRYASHQILDQAPLGNGDGVLDPGETAVMTLDLTNAGSSTAAAIMATIVGDRPGAVTITRDAASFPDAGPDATVTSLSPHYRYTASPDAVCGTPIRFDVQTLSSEGEGLSSFRIEVGRTFADYPATGLPLSLPKKTNSPSTSAVDVAEAFTLQDVNLALDLSHEDVGEIAVTLVSPQGTRVTLHNHSRAGTANLVTVYDRDTQPDGPGTMADFAGESSQGTWTLEVLDDQAGPSPGGTVNAWTLELKAMSPISCSPLACGEPIPGPVADAVTVSIESGVDLRFDWPALAGASGYRVWRSATPDFAEETLVGTTSSTTFVAAGELSSEGDAYYRVRAVNACEWEGP